MGLALSPTPKAETTRYASRRSTAGSGSLSRTTYGNGTVGPNLQFDYADVAPRSTPVPSGGYAVTT